MSYHYLLIVLLILFHRSFTEFCNTENRTDFYRSKSGQCLSCLTYCHGQTNVCLHIHQLERLCTKTFSARNLRECQEKLTPDIVHRFLLINASNENDFRDKTDQEPVCLFCGNSTRGPRCESCRLQPNGKQLSHLIELKTPTSTCFDCSCSGQTYQCQTNVTDGCACLSHLLDSNLVDLNLYQCLSNRSSPVEQERNQCRTKISHQCPMCKRGYSGVVTERGHRCFKLLSTDTIHCLDFSNSMKFGSNGPEVLRSEENRTFSFEITPSYRNLNIRVLIGIENGSVDVICSIRNSNFLVLNDTRLYLEYQSLTNDEPIIREYDLTKEDLNFGILYSDPSEIILVRNLSSRHRLTVLVSPNRIDFTQDNFRCIMFNQPIRSGSLPDLVDPSFENNSFSISDYRAIHLSSSAEILSRPTIGFIRIYQSRMNIDLFVFFSVFFSSFFLFLSLGICFWKVKFAYELHRRRRTIKHEYHKRMARPFAKIQLFVKPSKIFSNFDAKSEQFLSPVATSSVEIPLLLPSTRTDMDYSSHMIALEPLRDQNTCYTTLLFHLPGDLSTQYRLCAGTTLTQMPTDYGNALVHAHREAELQKRNRRRKRYHRRNRHRSKVLLKKTTTHHRQSQLQSHHPHQQQAQAQQQQQHSQHQQVPRRRKSNGRNISTTMTMTTSSGTS